MPTILEIVKPHLPEHLQDFKVIGPRGLDDPFEVRVLYRRRKSDPWSWLVIRPLCVEKDSVEKHVRTKVKRKEVI